MDASYWQRRWDEGQIAFHEGAPNRWLEEHVAMLGPGAGRRVVVPLCGKSVDLAFLAAHGFEVVGAELAMSAALAFFEEAGLAPSRAEDGDHVRLTAGSIQIVVGDFFALDAAKLGLFDAFYDRAAIVALPPALRGRYAETLTSLLRPVARGLTITFEHDGPGDSPPFSVSAEEIAQRFESFQIVDLGSVDVLQDRGSLKERGATFATERAYALRR